MKKYIAPEVEIKKFNVENIMTGSEIALGDNTEAAYDNAGSKATVSYSDLFTL